MRIASAIARPKQPGRRLTLANDAGAELRSNPGHSLARAWSPTCSRSRRPGMGESISLGNGTHCDPVTTRCSVRRCSAATRFPGERERERHERPPRAVPRLEPRRQQAPGSCADRDPIGDWRRSIHRWAPPASWEIRRRRHREKRRHGDRRAVHAGDGRSLGSLMEVEPVVMRKSSARRGSQGV